MTFSGPLALPSTEAAEAHHRRHIKQTRMPPSSRSVMFRSHESSRTRRLVTPTAHDYSQTPIIALCVWVYLTPHWDPYADARGRRWPAGPTTARGTDQMLDTNRLTLMSERRPARRRAPAGAFCGWARPPSRRQLSTPHARSADQEAPGRRRERSERASTCPRQMSSS